MGAPPGRREAATLPYRAVPDQRDGVSVLAGSLRAPGVTPKRARRLALTAIAALEGALIQARVAADATAILEVGEEIGTLFDAAVAAAPRASAQQA